MSTVWDAALAAIRPVQEAETGGGPTGFGWGSFVVAALGTVIVLRFTASLLAALRRAGRLGRSASPDRDTNGGT